MLNALTDFGIGSAFGTVSLVPLQLYKSHNKLKSKAAEEMDTGLSVFFVIFVCSMLLLDIALVLPSLPQLVFDLV